MKRNHSVFYRVIGVLALLCLIFPAISHDAYAAPALLTDYTLHPEYKAPEIDSPCAFVMEVNTGTILYAKNAHEPHVPASTIKTLTALLAAETTDLNEMVTFSESAVYDIEEGGNNYDMKVGETMSLRSCLKIMMMASCNEAAYCIAEHIGGSLSGFAELMNARASELGAVNSNFNNPHGLTDPEQYTTAHDLALIFAECVKNPLFMEVSAIESCCITDTSISSYGYVYANHDKMMQPDSVYYRDYVVCGKTGFTTQAGNTLVTYAEKDGIELICAILSGNGYDAVYNDTISLCDYAFENYIMLPTGMLADAQIEEEFGKSDIQYGVSGILVPFWYGQDDLSAEVSRLQKEDGAAFSGTVTITMGETVMLTSVYAQPVTQVFYASEVIPAPQPTPAATPAATPEPVPEAEETWGELTLFIHIGALCVFAVCVILLLISNIRLRREKARLAREAAAARN